MIYADDYQTLQAAINAAETIGGMIALSDTTYHISAPLTMSGLKSIWLVGEGWASVISNDGGGNGLVIGHASEHRTADIRILNLQFVGNASSDHGIVLQNIHSASVKGCKIASHGGDGINVVNGYANLIADNYVNNNTGNGIAAGADCNYLLLHRNKFLANGAAGVTFYDGSSSGSKIDRCDFEGNATGLIINAGTSASQAEAFGISGCTFENNVGKHISIGEDASIRYVDGLVISNNLFAPSAAVDPAVTCVSMVRARTALLIGNTFNVCNVYANGVGPTNTSNLWNGCELVS
jgi:hypothetical protein